MQRRVLLLLLSATLLAAAVLPVIEACRVSNFGVGHRPNPTGNDFSRSCDRRWPANQYFPSPCSTYGVVPYTWPGCSNLVNSAPENCSVSCSNSNGSVISFNLESQSATFKILINGYYLRNDGQWVKTTSCNSPQSCNITTTSGSFWYNLGDAWSIGFSTPWPTTWGSAGTMFASGLVRDGTEVYAPYLTTPGLSYGCKNTAGQYAPVTGTPGDWPPIYQVLYTNPASPWNCSNNGANYVVVHATLGSLSLCNTFAFTRSCTSVKIMGDPQFAGLRGQDYQVHGIDGGIYNIISDKYMQLNSKFVFLTGPRPCPMIPTTGRKSVACFAHAGSYLGNLALLTSAGDRVLIESGPAETGFALIEVNGRRLSAGEDAAITFADCNKTGSVTVTSSHEVILVAGLFEIELENSDSFINLRTVLVKGSNWKELTQERAHGLLGQTWNLRKGKSAIEGKVDDYLLESEDVFGVDFMYNRFGVEDDEEAEEKAYVTVVAQSVDS